MLKVFAFALSLIFVFVTNILAQDSQTQGQDAARQNWESVRAKAGSPDALKQHFVNPLLGGGLLSTIDNSKSGNVQIACPSSKEFLTVVIQPKGTGDFSAQIYWDRDLNGQMDSSLTVPNVSGVCADGFISCDPGTWNHCKDYQFVYSNGDLTLKEVALTDLSGCFCVNSSCGSNLVWNNLTLALKTFGGAVAGAMQQADPRFAISDARIDGAAIYFYGQKARDCTVASGGTGSLNPEQYYNSPFRIQSDTEIQVISQQQDPTSFYNLMLAPIKNMNIQTVQCSIKRVVTCSIQTAGCSITMSGNGWWHQDEQLMQLVGEGNKIGVYTEGVKTGEIIFPYGVTVTGVISSGTNNCGMSFWGEGNTLKASGEKGGGTLYFSEGGTTSGSFSILGSFSMSLNNGRGYVKVSGSSLLFYEDRFGSGGYIYFVAPCPLGNYPCTGNPPTCTKGQTAVEVSDNCSVYAQDPKCKLKDETVDGVNTYRNFISTGLKPLPSCKVFTCVDSVLACEDWWEKQRTYVCDSEGMDLSGAKRRLASVVPSSQYASGTITFTDVRKDPSGNWTQYPNQQFQVGGGQQGEACEQACRVRINVRNTQAGMSGPVSQGHTGLTPDYVYYYRVCYNGQCPVQSGEEMDIPCQCMNDFGAASTIMQSLRLASQDIICSTGNVRTLPGY